MFHNWNVISGNRCCLPSYYPLYTLFLTYSRFRAVLFSLLLFYHCVKLRSQNEWLPRIIWLLVGSTHEASCWNRMKEQSRIGGGWKISRIYSKRKQRDLVFIHYFFCVSIDEITFLIWLSIEMRACVSMMKNSCYTKWGFPLNFFLLLWRRFWEFPFEIWNRFCLSDRPK